MQVAFRWRYNCHFVSLQHICGDTFVLVCLFSHMVTQWFSLALCSTVSCARTQGDSLSKLPTASELQPMLTFCTAHPIHTVCHVGGLLLGVLLTCKPLYNYVLCDYTLTTYVWVCSASTKLWRVHFWWRGLVKVYNGNSLSCTILFWLVVWFVCQKVSCWIWSQRFLEYIH